MEMLYVFCEIGSEVLSITYWNGILQRLHEERSGSLLPRSKFCCQDVGTELFKQYNDEFHFSKG
jgi:hypothetical protein